jgi:N-acetylglucosaminyldiphosphoundecaprenol N-acetyl-beta-D-mannosaminyltransferase
MRTKLFGIDFDRFDQPELISEVLKRVDAGVPGYVLTINMHIVVRVRRDTALRQTLTDPRALVVPDGRPLRWMSRLRGTPIRLVTGSDLILPLCRAIALERRSVFLFGTTFDALAECGRQLSSAIEGLRIVGVYSPPYGFEQDVEESTLAASVIQEAAPDVVVLALGVPKQEIWAQNYATKLNIQAVCVGAALDFIAGVQRRAPLAFRRVGFEWLWRMLSEPRRLGMRYLNILCWMPVLVASELMAAARARGNRLLQ